jgi:hypothetical protein
MWDRVSSVAGRIIMRYLITAALLMGGFLQSTAAGGEPWIEQGQTAGRIVLQPEASPSEVQAAQELQAHIEACTQVVVPIEESSTVPEFPSIILGRGPVAEALGVTPTDDQLGQQGYQIKSVDGHVVIAGTAAVGTLYGAYDFLESYLGVRWFSPGVTRTPAAETFTLPEVDKLYRPTMIWRHTSYAWPGGDTAFRTRQRDNNGGQGADDPYGVRITHDGRCHTYFRYISPGEYFDEHPEYFSEIGGVRRREETQLCLTNPDVLEIVTEKMLARMAARPHDSQHNFSQMDYYSVCECANCRAMNAEYGTDGGTQFWFVNELAKRTSEVYPDKLIGTLAYMYTEEPPKGMKMHPNVAVWLCHMFPSCDSHPIRTCPDNADYKRRAEAWAKLTDHLYLWHYIVDFAHYYNPFPNFDALADNLRFYHELDADGIYLQGMGHGGGGGEFSLLRPYFATRLTWNPDLDPHTVIQEFLEGYYGAAAGPIHEYIRMLQAKVDDGDVHMHLYHNPGVGHFSDEILEKAQALFEEAEAAVADDDVLLERVRVARMPLVYAKGFPRNGYVVEGSQLKFVSPLNSLVEANAFIKRMKDHGFQTLRERNGPPDQMLLFSVLFGQPSHVVTLESDVLQADIIPNLGARVLRIIDKASGECLTAHNTVPGLFFPFSGGEEHRIGGIFDGFPSFGQFQVTEVLPDQATLTWQRPDGMRVTRVIILKGSDVVVETRVNNTTDKARNVVLRSHTEWDLGPVRDTSVRFTDRRGTEVTSDTDAMIAGQREGLHFRDEAAPDGAWQISGTKGFTVTQTWDDAAADFAWVYAYPERLGVFEVEVWNKPVDLAPGEETFLRHTLSVTR